MKTSLCYLKVDATLTSNPIVVAMLESVNNFAYMGDKLVGVLVRESLLVPMSEADMTAVISLKRAGYQLNVTSTTLTPVNLMTKYPFLSKMFVHYAYGQEALSDIEFNTLYKLGYIVAAPVVVAPVV